MQVKVIFNVTSSNKVNVAVIKAPVSMILIPCSECLPEDLSEQLQAALQWSFINPVWRSFHYEINLIVEKHQKDCLQRHYCKHTVIISIAAHALQPTTTHISLPKDHLPFATTPYFNNSTIVQLLVAAAPRHHEIINKY